MSLQVCSRLSIGALRLGELHLCDQLPDNTRSDLILQLKYILNLTVKSIGPKMRTCERVDQLSRDTYLQTGFSDAAFENLSDAKFAPHLLAVDRFALVGKTRIARDHEQGLETRQCGDDVLDHAVGKIFLLRVTAHILERHHCD